MTTKPLFKPSNLQILYNNARFSDVTLSFNGNKVHAIRGLLLGASDVFYKALTSKFSVNDDRNYDVAGYSNKVVYAMIRHIYGFQFDSEVKISTDDKANVDFYIQVYLIANEYLIESLKEAVANAVYDWMIELVEEGSETFDLMLESIISLYRTNILSEHTERKNPYLSEAVSLFRRTAQFCVKYRPYYVSKTCRRPGRRYRAFVREMACWVDMHDYTLLDPGCEWNANCTVEFSECCCRVIEGGWSDGFTSFVENFTARFAEGMGNYVSDGEDEGDNEDNEEEEDDDDDDDEDEEDEDEEDEVETVTEEYKATYT